MIEYLHIDYKKSKGSNLLDWRVDEPKVLLGLWLDEIKVLSENSSFPLNHLLLLNNVLYQEPKLIDLPNNYMDLYFYYTQMKCQFCNSLLALTMICLVCGKSIGICCEGMNIYDIAHSKHCVVGSRLYLNIQTTNVVILKKVDSKVKAGMWGTLYLDAYGEEDVELK